MDCTRLDGTKRARCARITGKRNTRRRCAVWVNARTRPRNQRPSRSLNRCLCTIRGSTSVPDIITVASSVCVHAFHCNRRGELHKTYK